MVNSNYCFELVSANEGPCLVRRRRQRNTIHARAAPAAGAAIVAAVEAAAGAAEVAWSTSPL